LRALVKHSTCSARDPTTGRILSRPLGDRLWEKVEKTETCWLWTGAMYMTGYGCIKAGPGDRKMLLTHRVAYELKYGPIPEGLLVCHTCDVRRCVRPDHLFLGSIADNIKDCARKGRNPRGEKCGQAKLTESQVVEMRTLRREQGLTYSARAARFGVSKIEAARICKRLRWGHVP
jgi:hypothetical protein